LAKAEIKTKQNDMSVLGYLSTVQDAQQRKDGEALLRLFSEITGLEPKMWGDSIIGYGNVEIKSPSSGRVVDWFYAGYALRKGKITLYLTHDAAQYAGLLARLGKVKHGKGCIYINKLADVNLEVLTEIIQSAVDFNLKNW